MHIEKYVAKNIISLCEKRDISKYRLSQLSGISQSSLSRIMTQESLPSLITLEKICVALGVTLSQFFREENPVDLTESQKEIFSQTVAIGCKRLEKYGKKPDRYGLIHSDLNINNILVDGDQVKILDFDDCGYGWFLFDLSTAVLEYDTNLSEMTRAWLDGYQTVRPLSPEDLQEVDTFIVLRKIVRMGWIASHWDNDTVKRVTDRYYTETEKLARAYCETNGGCL